MTTNLGSAPTGQPAKPRHVARRVALAAATLLIAASAGVGTGLATSSNGSPHSSGTSDYVYYQHLIGRYGSAMGPGMMTNYSWMTGVPGFAWMMGGSRAPGWMSGGALPRFMMGSSTDMGQVMGKLFADAPGPRVSQTDAARLSNQLPTGASVNRVANRITFTTTHVSFEALAGPAGGPDETFRIARLVNPTLVVPTGSHVRVQVINADPDAAHGLVIAAGPASSSSLPMMGAAPAFTVAALWFLAEPTSAGMHLAVITFTASKAGTYTYLCPVPGHARHGMEGTFIIKN